MGLFSDWKFWMFAVSLCQTGLMVYGFIIIKYNDFKHLGKDVTEIQEDVKMITSKVIKIDKKLAVQKQRIDDLEKSTR